MSLQTDQLPVTALSSGALPFFVSLSLSPSVGSTRRRMHILLALNFITHTLGLTQV